MVSQLATPCVPYGVAMIRRTARTLLLPLALALAAGCSSSATKAGSSATSVASGGATTATASSGTSGSTAAGSTGTVAKSECEGLRKTIATMSVNWQVLVQLVNATKVSEWNERAKVIGSLPNFAENLDALQAAFGGSTGAADSVTYMRGANDIVQKGLGGDESAIASLKSYLGTNLVESLTKQAPIGQAFSDTGC